MKLAWFSAGWLLLLAAVSGAEAVPVGSKGDSSPAASGVAVIELLDQLRVEEAAALLPQVPDNDPVGAHASALFAFYRGDYEAAAAALPAEGAREGALEERLGWLRKRLPAVRSATEGMAEKVEGHFIYRYQPGPDAILVEYAGKALEGQRAAMGKLFGGQPGLPTVVEFFPDEASFVSASGLPASWVRTTGTVAICKWDRILVLSPRNLSRGYPWQDTLAHEYVHLALSRASRNHAPVWFHEGSAKLLESAWRDPLRRDFTGPWAESLLA
ncbi:MAG: hypothetical protein VX498_13400, partial [Myxococcota bacterium]|nr:hypothetical protein [Myxococcota bacterium]